MVNGSGTVVVTKVARIKLTRPSKALRKDKEREREPSQVSQSSTTPQTASSVPAGQPIQRKHGALKNCYSWWSSRPWWPGTAHWCALLLIAVAIWGVIYSMTEGVFLPGSQLFSMITLFTLAYLGGQVAVFCKMPALLGMLLTGMILRNTGLVSFSGEYMHVSAVMREIALSVILTRAGLGLDPTALKSLSLMIARLAVIPSIVEGTFTTVMTHYLLGIPWLWGILLAAILAAVSPAVVIPCLFSLQERGYGTNKGIPTLIVAAASFDDILAISVFGVLIGVIFATGDLTATIIQGPVGVILGILFGLFWGAMATQVPHKDDNNVVALRSLMIGGGGLVAILGSSQIGYQGAGPLGCIVLAFVACLGWRREGWGNKNNPVGVVFETVWAVFQPILFGLIGSEVDVTVLEPAIVGYGVLSLFVAIVGRIVVSVFIAYGADFSWKEKIFVACAWLPKATVQAALGPVALDIARKSGTPEEVTYAGYVLIIAVLAILLTAPAGAVLITVLGPRLLTKEVPADSSMRNRGDVSQHENSEGN